MNFTGYPRRPCLCCERIACICLSPGEVPDVAPEASPRKGAGFGAVKRTRAASFEPAYQRLMADLSRKEAA
jgi:hypothetical protein